MSVTQLPWGINRLSSAYWVGPDGPLTELSEGQWVRAVCVPYDTLGSRLRAAWWVLTGRAHAFVWPEAGEIETIIHGPKP